MGEEPWRVHRAGAPSLDHLRRSNLLDRPALEQRLGLTLLPPTLLALWHPVTIHRDTNAEADAFFTTMAQVAGQLLFVLSQRRLRQLRAHRTDACARGNPSPIHTIFVNLDAVTYWSLLGQVDVMVGNSSSGIMEAASFALPVVNVGMRQQGRERARNIIDAPAESDAIRLAIERALSPVFRAGLSWHGQSLWRWNRRKHHRPLYSLSISLEGILIKQPAPIPSTPKAQAESERDC